MNGVSKKVTPRQYKKLSGGSSIDESLFSASSSKKKDVIPAGAIVIGIKDLQKIKEATTIKTEAEEQAEREKSRQAKEEKEQKAKERKERMMQLERQAKSHMQKSDIELEQEARDEAIRQLAAEKLNENSDINKMLKTLAARAAAFTIRDQQLEDKRRLEAEEVEYERRMDMVMELDRLKDLQRRDEEETIKRAKRVEAKRVIEEQIKARERVKLLAAEAREQESQQMKSLMKKYEDDDAVSAAKRKIEIERSKVEVITANEEAIRRKRELKELEKQEVDEILRYQALKAAEAARREEEEMLLERQKKELQAKMLASQERSQNKQAEVDEIRARRAGEVREREARRAEREAAEKKKVEMAKLQADRAKQAEDRHISEKKEKAAAEIEFARTIAHVKEQARVEEIVKEKQAAAAKVQRELIKAQISEVEAQRKLEREKKFEQGAKIKDAELLEIAKMKAMQEEMMRSLDAKGINPKYLSEMKAVNIEKALKR